MWTEEIGEFALSYTLTIGGVLQARITRYEWTVVAVCADRSSKHFSEISQAKEWAIAQLRSYYQHLNECLAQVN